MPKGKKMLYRDGDFCVVVSLLCVDFTRLHVVVKHLLICSILTLASSSFTVARTAAEYLAVRRQQLAEGIEMTAPQRTLS
jgi:hypothetical protein